MRNEREPKPGSRKPLIILAVVWVITVLIAPSAIKWALYERPDVAPRLRSLIGSEVTIPARILHVMGTDIVDGPHTGQLEFVNYRFNDKWGWFDLCVGVGASDGNGGVNTGLSPGEAERVVVAVDDD